MADILRTDQAERKRKRLIGHGGQLSGPL